MGLTDEIRELKELHDVGTLTDAEFAQAKAALFADRNRSRGRSASDSSRPDNALGAAAKSWVNLQVIMAIVGVVLSLLLFFVFFLPHWNKSQADFDRRWNEFPGPPKSGR